MVCSLFTWPLGGPLTSSSSITTALQATALATARKCYCTLTCFHSALARPHPLDKVAPAVSRRGAPSASRVYRLLTALTRSHLPVGEDLLPLCFVPFCPILPRVSIALSLDILCHFKRLAYCRPQLCCYATGLQGPISGQRSASCKVSVLCSMLIHCSILLRFSFFPFEHHSTEYSYLRFCI